MQQKSYTEAVEQLSTVHDVIRWGVSRFHESGCFHGHGYDNAWDEALALVLHALHLHHYDDPRLLTARLTHSEREDIINLFKQRIIERVPVAYLTNQAIFCGLEFYVDERVLIPRSPIAELIEKRFSPWIEASQVTRICDMCTGSACIAIACMQAFPDAIVDAVDIAKDALAVAKINVERHQLVEKVRLIQEDLFNGLLGQRYDIIIANPPYEDTVEIASLPKEYLHEPVAGLDGGPLGLDDVVRILYHASDYLRPNGILILEVGNAQPHLEEFFPQVPFTWLDFERGGEGVCLLTEAQLIAHKQDFAQSALKTEAEG